MRGDLILGRASGRPVEEDIRDLMALCSNFVLGETLAFALLLRQVGVSRSRSQSELESHAKAMLEETREHGWRSGLVQHWYFMEQLDDKFLSDSWSIVNDTVLEAVRGYNGLWSRRLKWKEITAYRNIEDYRKAFKDVKQKLALLGKNRERKDRRNNTTPTSDEEAIIYAINNGSKGGAFCKLLDNVKVGPRPGWKRGGNLYTWPGNYKTAYGNPNLACRKFWRSRIYNYRDDVKRKFPGRIHCKNSPTRQGE